MALLLPKNSAATARMFVKLDVAIVAAFQTLMEVLPALVPELSNIALFRKYENGTLTCCIHDITS